MAQKPGRKPAEMESRASTPEEIAAIAVAMGVTGTLPNVAEVGQSPSGMTESDDEAAAHQARIWQREREAMAPPPLAGIPVGEAVLSPDEFQSRMLKALENLNARKDDAGVNSAVATAMMMLAEALQGLKQTTLDAARMQADMQRRVHRPENNFPPDISVFNLRGDKDFKRPRLKCEFFIPWPVTNDQESLTREELELLNLLTPGEFSVLRSDRTRIKMTVRQINKLDSDAPSRIMINHDTGFNNDNQRLLPFDWMRQLAMANPKIRTAVANVLTMEEEEALILAGKFNDGRVASPEEHLVSVGE